MPITRPGMPSPTVPIPMPAHHAYCFIPALNPLLCPCPLLGPSRPRRFALPAPIRAAAFVSPSCAALYHVVQPVSQTPPMTRRSLPATPTQRKPATPTQRNDLANDKVCCPPHLPPPLPALPLPPAPSIRFVVSSLLRHGNPRRTTLPRLSHPTSLYRSAAYCQPHRLPSSIARTSRCARHCSGRTCAPTSTSPRLPVSPSPRPLAIHCVICALLGVPNGTSLSPLRLFPPGERQTPCPLWTPYPPPLIPIPIPS